MQDLYKTKNRREFLKGGLRAVLFGCFAFTGLFLGWRRYSCSGRGLSGLANLPCRGCSKLPECREPRAINARQKPNDSRLSSSRMKRGILNDR